MSNKRRNEKETLTRLYDSDGNEITATQDGDKYRMDVSSISSGSVSSVNTSIIPIASGATFTGIFEQNSQPNVGVSLKSNIGGTLFFDFSNDGINVDTFPVNGFGVTANIHEFHTAIKLGRYFRIRFVMDSGIQTTMRLYTYYGTNFFPSSTPTNSSITDDVDTSIVRVASDHKLDLARGFIGGQTVVHKFGENPAIASSSTEDISFSGVINWLTAATTVRVKAGNVADTSNGDGARTIRIEGLDENFVDDSAELTTAGTSASSSTTTTFIRVFRAYVLTTGLYTGVNIANVVIENTAGNTDLITIAAGLGQTEFSGYTVPAGKTAYLTRVEVEVDGNKAVDVKFFQRQDADDVSAPFTAKRIIIEFPALIGTAERPFDAYIKFPAKTDLWWVGTTGSGNAAAVETDYDLILVDN